MSRIIREAKPSDVAEIMQVMDAAICCLATRSTKGRLLPKGRKND